jgi:hypothetical protein
MADRAAISRVAKILARANSDNQAEAEAALRGAFGRMNRDGVTITDLLSLPEQELYQDALVRLADLIVKSQENLSPAQKRAIYAEYLSRIVAKFSGGQEDEAQQGRAQQQEDFRARSQAEQETRSQEHAHQDSRDREREEAARAYEERRQREEARRDRSEAPRRDSPPQGEDQYSRQNGFTPKDVGQDRFSFDSNRVPLDFSLQELWTFLFGRGSLFVCMLAHPFRGAILVLISCLAGFFLSALLVLVAGLVANAAPNVGRPLMAVMTKWEIFGIPWFAVVICICFMFYRHERGWFPVLRRRGAPGLIEILKMLIYSMPGIFWRCLAPVVWVVNWFYRYSEQRQTIQPELEKAPAPQPINTSPPIERESIDIKAQIKRAWNIFAYIVEICFIVYCLGAIAVVFGAILFGPRIPKEYHNIIAIFLIIVFIAVAIPLHKWLCKKKNQEGIVLPRAH